LAIHVQQRNNYQQNLANRRIAILEISTNKLRRIQAAAAHIQLAISRIQTGEFRQLRIA